jgi:DNA-binding transcriptional MocR family regulator
MSARYAVIPAQAVGDSRLSRTGLALLCALSLHADRHGRAGPAQAALAARLGITRQAVGKYAKELEDLGYIEKERRFGADGGELPCRYRLLSDIALPPEADRHPEDGPDSGEDPENGPPEG